MLDIFSFNHNIVIDYSYKKFCDLRNDPFFFHHVLKVVDQTTQNHLLAGLSLYSPAYFCFSQYEIIFVSPHM